MSSITQILLSLCIAILYTGGDAMATKYFETNKYVRLVGSFVCMCLGLYIFGYVASKSNMAIVSSIAMMINILLNIAVGIYHFGNPVTMIQRIGISISIVSIGLLTIKF